ncbi:MAG: tyrosine-type recombinase/integrase, partial [Terriglobia bacterium]
SILADHGLWAAIRRDVERLDENESAGRALLPDEEARLLQAASQVGVKQGHWSPIYTVTVLGLNTGLRHSEVRKLRWTDVDMERRVIVVGKSKSDSSTGRPVPIIPPAWAALDMWQARFPNRKPSDYVFPACQNGNLNPAKPISHWRTAWSKACELAGLPGLRYHDLRHSAATKMLENGVPMPTVAHILGWSASTAIRMAKRYGHIRPDAQRRALESIATPMPDSGLWKSGDFEAEVHQKVHQLQKSN